MPVPYSYVDFGTAGDLNSTQIGGTFAPTGLEYVNTTDIYVTVTQVGGAITALTSPQFTVTTSPALQVVIKAASAGGVDLTATDEVRIGRTTSIDEAARVFSDGSVLKASDLNTQTNQLLYSVQESIDTGGGALPIETDNAYNAGNRRIKNLGTAINEGDAVSLGYVTGLALYNSGSEPQSWSVLKSGMTVSGDNLTYILTTPTPATAIDSMYLIEIDGVMQVPTTDYTVVYDGGIYTLTLIGTGITSLPDETKITIRNFGVSQNVLSQPYQAGSVTGDALSIEKASGSHTGNLIDVEDESGNDLFRVEDDGQVVLGNGATTAVGTASLSTTKLELGSVQNATGAQGSPDSHGALLYTSGGNGLLELQGDEPASGDYAIRVYDWKSSGENEVALTVTYGGALTISGAASVGGALTVGGAFTLTGDAAINGDVTLEAEHKLSVGASGTEVVEEGLNDVQRIKVEKHVDSNDGNAGIVSADGDPGAIVFNDAGEPSLRAGGDGTSVAHGGAGSIYFTKTNNSKGEGPHIKATVDGVKVGGFKIPTLQGGVDGEDGGTKAGLILIDHDTKPIADVLDIEVLCKKQITDYIAANAFVGSYLIHPGTASVANGARELVQISGSDHRFRPDGGISVNGTEDFFAITKGIWMVDYSCRVTNLSETDRAKPVINAQHIINASPPSGATDGTGDGTSTWNNIGNDASDTIITLGAVNDGSVPIGMLRIVFTVGGREATDAAASLETTTGGINNANYKFRIVHSEEHANSAGYSISNQIMKLTRVE